MSMFKSVLCLINYSITWTTGSINFGCVGRAVASDIRGPQFESQSSANIFIQNMHLLTTVEKTKIAIKRAFKKELLKRRKII